MTGGTPSPPHGEADDQDASPWQPPQESSEFHRSVDPSVYAEPWMQDVAHAEDTRDPGPAMPFSVHGPEDQSVWDEPGLTRQLAGATPEDAVTWFRWYQQKVTTTTVGTTWLVTSGVVLVAGLLAILGTLATQSTMGSQLLAVVIFGPTTEEIMKIAIPLWLIEKRPWLYRSSSQILLCALGSGAAFAAVENLIYLNVYVPQPTASLVAWRWTVCVLLHAGSSVVAGVGATRIWHRFQQEQRVPQLSDGARWIVGAIIIHGLYNGTVTLLEFGGLDF